MPDPAPASNRFVIGAVIAIAAVFAMALGLTYPLLAIILEGQGVAPTLIGVNTAMTPLGIICSAPFIPWLSRRLGAWRLAVGCALLTAIVFLAIGAWRNVWFWFPLRFVLGISIDSLYVLSETWLLQLSNPSNRGKLIGTYATVMAAGFTIGPFALALLGSEGWTALGVGIAIMLLTAYLLLLVRTRLPAHGANTHGSIFSFTRLAPMLLLAVGIVAVFDQVALSLLPVYLLDFGMSEARVAVAIGVLVVGNVVLQYPIGWLSDKAPRAQVLGGCIASVLLCSALLPFALGTLALWPVLFVLGSTGFGIYTVTLAELGDRFEGERLLAGNAAFAMMWGIGGIAGPPITGFAMDSIGPHGLPLTLLLAFSLLLLARRGFRTCKH